MLRMIALTAALALGATVAPLPGSEAQAARESYRQCVARITNDCLPGAPNNPSLPPAGSPAEEAYYQCIEAGMAYCMGLPDAPH